VLLDRVEERALPGIEPDLPGRVGAQDDDDSDGEQTDSPAVRRSAEGGQLLPRSAGFRSTAAFDLRASTRTSMALHPSSWALSLAGEVERTLGVRTPRRVRDGLWTKLNSSDPPLASIENVS
jgi:hypothetical protein